MSKLWPNKALEPTAGVFSFTLRSQVGGRLPSPWLSFCPLGGFERMTQKPRMAKAHSKQVADEYLRLGWTLCSESRVAGFDEPAEYYFEWQRADEPISIDWIEFNRKHEPAA